MGGSGVVHEFNKHVEEASRAIVKTISQETDQVRNLRSYNERQRDHDPAKVAWPASLPIELALKTATPQELKGHYGFSDDEWAALRGNPVFIAELTAACDLVKQEGMTFRLKARLQAEAMLETSWRLVHAPGSEVPANVKADLIKTTFRVAGFDNKEGLPAGAGSGLAIQINFNGGQPTPVIEAS